MEKRNEMIVNLLVNAFEGGSNYWYTIENHNQNDVPECRFLSELLSFEQGEMSIDYTIGYSKEFGDVTERKRIKYNDVLIGFLEFATNEKYKKHFQDALNGNDDATTADVFLQLVVFGEVIFG